MSVQFVLKEYSMSGINYEALGRCHHLKDLIHDLHRERDSTFGKIKHSYTEPSQDAADTVHYIDVSEMYNHVLKLRTIDAELMTAIDEYNKWAKEASLPLIKIIRQLQVPS